MGDAVKAAQPVMSDAEFRMFCELVRKHCGLHFGPDSRYLVEKRVSNRVRETGVASFAAYQYRLRNDSGVDPELAKLVDDLTTNETYFLRERAQLREKNALSQHMASTFNVFFAHNRSQTISINVRSIHIIITELCVTHPNTNNFQWTL